MRKTFFSTVCGGLLIASLPGLVQARASDDPPAATPAPAAPAAAPGIAPVVPSAVAPAAPTITATLAAAAPGDAQALAADALKLAQTGKDWSQIYLLSSRGSLPETKVSVDQKNAKIKDVLKDALDQAKVGYVFDADVPDDARVSVKLDNVKIGTALDAITESADLKWIVSVERAGRAGSAVVRVGKKLPGSVGGLTTLSNTPYVRGLFDPTLTVTPGAPVMPSLTIAKPGEPLSVFLENHRTVPDVAVSLKKEDSSAKEVFQEIAKQAKIDLVFDADVPEDKKVSVELRNVKTAEALDAAAKTSGLKWYSQTDKGKTVVHVSKNLPNDVSVFYSPYDSRVVANILGEFQGNTPRTLHGTLNQAMPSYTRVFRSRETRSTFTCPNCHNQVTIIRKDVDVKCPTCQREFEPGWKVCPFDGTKRPEAKDDWKFCPICGKPIPDGVAAAFTTPTPEDPLLSYQPLLTPPLPAAPLAEPEVILPATPPIEYK